MQLVSSKKKTMQLISLPQLESKLVSNYCLILCHISILIFLILVLRAITPMSA